MNFVGLNVKQRAIELFLMISGTVFYHLVLRPVDYWRSRKKNRNSKSKRQPA